MDGWFVCVGRWVGFVVSMHGCGRVHVNDRKCGAIIPGTIIFTVMRVNPWLILGISYKQYNYI